MTAAPPPVRPQARWILPEAPDAVLVRRLCDELKLPEPVCRLLALRGHEAESAKRYLRPRLEQLLPPEQLLDLNRAVERLVQAIRAGETILVHGDYDVDGMTVLCVWSPTNICSEKGPNFPGDRSQAMPEADWPILP